MRLLILAVSLAVLSGVSYWALTGPLAPGGPGVEGVVAGLQASAAEVAQALPFTDDPDAPEDPAYALEAPVFSHVTRESYAVEGRTADEVLRSLLDRGPRSGDDIFFGLTNTGLDVHYDPTEVAGGCIIRNTRVHIRVKITLPEWAPPAGVDPQTVTDWGRFRRALEAHEDRHRQIAVETGHKAYRAVAELYRPSCEEAVEEARRRLERIGVEDSGAHRRFDTTTQHGRTEGALWPLER